MTTFVYIDNYRGFSSAAIPLRRVNFLVGENSTGKTSFLELLETLSYPPFWLFDPRFGDHGAHQRHFLDLVSASAKNKSTFTIGAIAVSKELATQDYGMFVTYSNSDGRPLPSRVSIVEGGHVRTVDGHLWRSKKGEKYRARVRTCAPCTEDGSLERRARKHANIHISGVGFQGRVISEEKQGSPLFHRCSDDLFGGEEIGDRFTKVPYPFRSDFVDVAPIRTRPRRTYDAPQTDFSPEGDHTPYVIKKLLASKSQAEDFRGFLEAAGRESGLFQSIRVKSYGRGPLAPFEMQVVLGKSALSMENVGYGVSQSLPVLVEMFVRPRRTAFTIQQPEVHLHPKAQAAFGDLVAQLARDEEKRFIIETHSDFAIDRFRLNLRRRGGVPSQLLFFERKDDVNNAISIPIDAAGNLPDSQPEGYREFFFNESLSLLG